MPAMQWVGIILAEFFIMGQYGVEIKNRASLDLGLFSKSSETDFLRDYQI